MICLIELRLCSCRMAASKVCLAVRRACIIRLVLLLRLLRWIIRTSIFLLENVSVTVVSMLGWLVILRPMQHWASVLFMGRTGTLVQADLLGL